MSFEVGDKVIDLRFGEGKVICTFNLVHVFFEKQTNPNIRTLEYTRDGKIAKTDMFPTLYHVEGFTPPSCKEPERNHKCEFKPFDKVLVRVYTDEMWRPQLFWRLDNFVGEYQMLDSGWWKYCIPYEGNEDKCGKVTD